jgi:putative chitinase
MSAITDRIDGALLHGIAPPVSGRRAAHQAGIIDGMKDALGGVLAHYAIDTPLRVAHFLAQVAHESDGFSTVEEYASGSAYEGRKDLGNTQPGDGRRYKGRGLIQLTGRTNYASIGRDLGLPLVDAPETVCDPHTYLLVSCLFWARKAINARADRDDLVGVTRAVNGGLNGLDSRRAYLANAKRLLADVAAGGAEPAKPGGVVLRLGSQGDDVVALQEALGIRGYPVPVDGAFGSATLLAVRHYQAAVGLADDGIVGAKTWAGLKAREPSTMPA